MARAYADISAIISRSIQDAGVAEYVAASVNDQIPRGLEEISARIPHIVEVVFKIESRSGTDVTGTAGSLTDLVKLQFLAGDATDEKVIHNTTDHTWAVVTTHTSTSVLVLSADIMDANEKYEIYNKRCWNKKQIFIGDVGGYSGIDSVEYPVGQKRNWKVYGEVLEIDVDNVEDSDSTLTDKSRTEVLVRFIQPHRLCQLTDLAGACTAIEPVGETTLAVKTLLGAEVIEVGDELHIADQRATYTVTTGVTLAGSGAGNGTGNIVVFPGMEVATAVEDVITFVKSTLSPTLENILVDICAGRLMINRAAEYTGLPTAGGMARWSNLLRLGEGRLAEALGRLHRDTPRITKRSYPSD